MQLEPNSKLQLSGCCVFLLCFRFSCDKRAFYPSPKLMHSFFSPSSLLYFSFLNVNNICAAVITGISNGDFSANSLIGDTCAGLPSFLINMLHFHTLLSFSDLTFSHFPFCFSFSSLYLLCLSFSLHSLRALAPYSSCLPLGDCGLVHLTYVTAA